MRFTVIHCVLIRRKRLLLCMNENEQLDNTPRCLIVEENVEVSATGFTSRETSGAYAVLCKDADLLFFFIRLTCLFCLEITSG